MRKDDKSSSCQLVKLVTLVPPCTGAPRYTSPCGELLGNEGGFIIPSNKAHLLDYHTHIPPLYDNAILRPNEFCHETFCGWGEGEVASILWNLLEARSEAIVSGSQIQKTLLGP